MACSKDVDNLQYDPSPKCICIHSLVESPLLQVQIGDGVPVLVGDINISLNLIVIIVPVVVGGFLILLAILITVIICCVCWYVKRKTKRVELERLKDKMSHEKEKEDLHQQVENVISQMQVLHVQMQGKLFHKQCTCVYILACM